MGSALARGRTLNPQAVKTADSWRRERIKYLEKKKHLKLKEAKELAQLKGQVLAVDAKIAAQERAMAERVKGKPSTDIMDRIRKLQEKQKGG